MVSQLGPLYHMIESRVKLYQQLMRLHGKLYLLMMQVRLHAFTCVCDEVQDVVKFS